MPVAAAFPAEAAREVDVSAMIRAEQQEIDESDCDKLKKLKRDQDN